MNDRPDTPLLEMLGGVYKAMEGSDVAADYSARHGIKSAAVLTVTDDEIAAAIAEILAPRIEGRTVIEIGGGIGLLAFHLAGYAKRVYCIEANPMWSWTFASLLLARKPKNVSYLFGAADEFIGRIRGHIALFCTHSDVGGMRRVAKRFGDQVIDVWGEIIEDNPAFFDPNAVALRQLFSCAA